jgi:hypothetical protein
LRKNYHRLWSGSGCPGAQISNCAARDDDAMRRSLLEHTPHAAAVAGPVAWAAAAGPKRWHGHRAADFAHLKLAGVVFGFLCY